MHARRLATILRRPPCFGCLSTLSVPSLHYIHLQQVTANAPRRVPDPVSPTPSGPTATMPRQIFERLRRQLHQIISSEVSLEYESDCDDDRATSSGG